jgi:hypothetical protein
MEEGGGNRSMSVVNANPGPHADECIFLLSFFLRNECCCQSFTIPICNIFHIFLYPRIEIRLLELS